MPPAAWSLETSFSDKANIPQLWINSVLAKLFHSGGVEKGKKRHMNAKNTHTSKGTASKLPAAKQWDSQRQCNFVILWIKFCSHAEHMMVIKYRNRVKAENKGKD